MQFERTGNSANIVFYGQRPRRAGYFWVEVLCAAIEKVGGKWQARKRPIYNLTVYKHGTGVVTEFKYEPTRKPAGGELSPATVARLVQDAVTVRER